MRLPLCSIPGDKRFFVEERPLTRYELFPSTTARDSHTKLHAFTDDGQEQ